MHHNSSYVQRIVTVSEETIKCVGSGLSCYREKNLQVSNVGGRKRRFSGILHTA